MAEKNTNAKSNFVFTKKTSLKQKWAVGLLLFIALIIISVWIAQMRNNLRSGIYGDESKNAKLKAMIEADLTAQARQDDSLKKMDTDHDGLSDWDELNIYKTSPYLEDTDGDGIVDGKELKNGSDPLCPEGKTCLAPEINSGQAPETNSGHAPDINPGQVDATADQNSALADLLKQVDNSQGVNPNAGGVVNSNTSGSAVNSNTGGGVAGSSGAVSPSAGSGIVGSGSAVNSTTTSGSAVNSNNQAIPNSAPTGAAMTAQEKQVVQQVFGNKQIDAKAFRDILKQGGVDQSVINNASDDQLMTIYKQIMSQ